MKAALLAAAALVAACGKKGEDKVGAPPPAPTVQGVIDTSVKAVTGTVYLGDTAHPAAGFELWTLDHTGRTFRRDILPEGGKVSLPIDGFTQDSLYTMHLVKSGVLFADVDLSAAAGVQAAFTYEGGPGYELGALILAVDAHGDVDPAVTDVQGRIGGGFRAQPDEAASFGSFPVPSGVTRLAIGSQLYVFEPSSLLHSFYQRAQNPALYAQDLAAFSRFGVRADAAAADTLRKVQILEAGPWLAATRLAAADGDPPHGMSALWSATNYLVPASGKLTFGASAFVGAVPSPRSTILLKAQVGDKDPEASLPMLLGPVVTVPPLLASIDLGGGTLAAVDYAAAGANGLTRAFCPKGALQLGLSAPKDQAGAPIPATLLDTIEIVADYYGVAADGKVVTLAVVPADFPVPYQVAVDDTVGDSARAWSPETRTFRVTIGPLDAAKSPNVLPFPAGLFMVNVAAGGVFYVRLRVYYKSSKGATEGAFAIWFDNACP